MSFLEWIAERRIVEAQSQGAFDGLPGCGRPLGVEDDSGVPSEWRAAFHLLKSAGFAPDWVTQGREIDRGRRRLRAALERGEVLQSMQHAEVEALNRAIDDFNLRVPHACLQKPRFRV